MTLTILFKSAAQLAFNFGDYQAMKQMIGFALTGNSDKVTTRELKQLLNETEIDRYIFDYCWIYQKSR